MAGRLDAPLMPWRLQPRMAFHLMLADGCLRNCVMQRWPPSLRMTPNQIVSG